MRKVGRLLLLTSLLAWLGACARNPPPSVDATADAAPVAPRLAEPFTSVADSGLAIAVARESADRAVREQTLRVQKRLRDQDNAWKQARDEAQRNSNERCMAGQKMRRVANGWVQAGVC